MGRLRSSLVSVCIAAILLAAFPGTAAAAPPSTPLTVSVASMAPVVISAGMAISLDGAERSQSSETGSDKNHNDFIILHEGGRIDYRFTVPKAGNYYICFDYYPLPGVGGDIVCDVRKNDRPIREKGTSIQLERLWKDEGAPEQDQAGNEIRPAQVEVQAWTSKYMDEENGSGENASYYFEQGEQTLSFQSIQEPVMLGDIRLIPASAPETYEQVKKTYTYPLAKGTDYIETIQGEAAVLKSDPSLYARADRSSPFTQPFAYDSILLNTIGGKNWSGAGQWIEWEITVPRDGLYKIGMRYRQNFTTAIFTTRKLTIDGVVPFGEAAKLRFPYSNNWQSVVLGNGTEDYLFQLKKGKHRLRLQAVLGDMAEPLATADSILMELNSVYREIMAITGVSPDPYRDYFLENEIPKTLDKLKELSRKLAEFSESLTELFGKKSDQNALIDLLFSQTKEFASNPRTVSDRLQAFKNNLSALGSWIYNLRNQCLELDYFVIMPDGAEAPPARVGFFQGLLHELRLFFQAFFTEYQSAETDHSNENKSIEVWTTAGREQAQIISRLVKRYYVPQRGQAVQVRLVDPSALLPSVLSGKGPDIALGNSSTTVMDFAARGAIRALDDVATPEFLTDNFYESALLPLKYEGALYGLPETQTFPMLFYRTDILEGLNLPVPKTWSDLYNILYILSQNQMKFGLLPGLQSYAMFLYQAGGSFYSEDYTHSALDSNAAIKAFKSYTDLYLKYSVEQSFDFANRFRSGEMPIGIADYTIYNQLIVFAPEIRGLWKFAPVLGLQKEDGSTDHSSSSGVTGAMMFSKLKDPRAGADFLEWWTGEQAQILYGREQEATMGAAARYPAANRRSIKALGWQLEQLKLLAQQMSSVVAIPEVPGGYYTARYVDFAFRSVVLERRDIREVLLNYTEIIDDEIQMKRQEFGLPKGR